MGDAALIDRIEQFLYHEAACADEHDYEAWDALWDDDGIYWVPANGDGGDPEREMSILYDNRSRIRLRVKQLLTGRRLAQSPFSRLARTVGNVRLLERNDDVLVVAANVLIYESHTRGEQLWGARVEYRLRAHGESFRMSRKKVVLCNNHKALYSMAFLV